MDNSTHIEDMKDPIEVQFPSSNLLLVALCVEKSSSSISPAPFDEGHLNLCHSSTLGAFSGWSRARIAGPTHVVNWFIASDTD